MGAGGGEPDGGGRRGRAAGQQRGRGGVAAQGAEGGEVVRVGAVAGAQGLVQQCEVAAGGAGEGGAVPGEVGHQEGA